MRSQRAGLSRHAAVATAIDCMLKRWNGFALLLDDVRICLTNNGAQADIGIKPPSGRYGPYASEDVPGSSPGPTEAACGPQPCTYTLIGTAKLNDVDPQAWLADILDRIADLPQTRLHELLPWNWKGEQQQALAA